MFSHHQARIHSPRRAASWITRAGTTAEEVSDTPEGEADPKLDIAFTHSDECAGCTTTCKNGSDTEEEGSDEELEADHAAGHVLSGEAGKIGTELVCMLAEEEDRRQCKSHDDSPGELRLAGEAGIPVGCSEAEARALEGIAETETDEHQKRGLGVGGCNDEGDDCADDDNRDSNDDLDLLVACLLLGSESLPVGSLVGHWRHEELQELSTDCCAKEDEEKEEPGRQRELGQLGEETSDVTATSHLGTEAHQKTADDGGQSLLVVLDVPDLPLGSKKTGHSGTEHNPGVGEGRLAAEEAVCLEGRVLEDTVSTRVDTEEIEQECTPVAKGAGDAPGASDHAQGHREDDDENRTGVIGPLPLENDIVERGLFKLIVLIHSAQASTQHVFSMTTSHSPSPTSSISTL